MKMKAVRSSETSVNLYQTTRHHIPKDSTFDSHRCRNFKTHKLENFEKPTIAQRVKKLPAFYGTRGSFAFSRRPGESKVLCNISQPSSVQRGADSPPPKLQAGEPPLVGRPSSLIQYNLQLFCIDLSGY
jgi:hypothetical protein